VGSLALRGRLEMESDLLSSVEGGRSGLALGLNTRVLSRLASLIDRPHGHEHNLQLVEALDCDTSPWVAACGADVA